MLLIADSGSTKCDWILLDGEEQVISISTMGFNPYFHDQALIASALKYTEDLKRYANEVTHIHFYGAGCSSKELNRVVKNALEEVFPNARVNVTHDLVGAAYATYQGEPEIACILGTGSNSCFFDGARIVEEVPALAYILGDEGSGSYYGKKLLADYLYNRLPEEIHVNFLKEYSLTKDDIMENVYMKPHGNVYLASFMKFVSGHREHPYFRKMVTEGMRTFLETHVCCFPNYKEVPVNFVGSIAYYFEDLLREVAEELDIEVKNIVKKPILGLVNFHLQHKVKA